ncbi:hypothetical protein M405DRAFT_866890 [Rhizopogon salebrosus TDB-379]|nr:hypothetical protein M405DRAFT_866890 [Rhizopogon salebrosus TDB-379]
MPALEKLVGALFMIMGTDVGHLAPGLKNQPSVASLIRSSDRFAARYEAMISIQHPRQEKSTSCANSFIGTVEVKATAGDTHLGGEDFDNRLTSPPTIVLSVFYGWLASVPGTPSPWLRRPPSRSIPSTKGIDFMSVLTRARFEELCGDLSVHRPPKEDDTMISVLILGGGHV